MKRLAWIGMVMVAEVLAGGGCDLLGCDDFDEYKMIPVTPDESWLEDPSVDSNLDWADGSSPTELTLEVVDVVEAFRLERHYCGDSWVEGHEVDFVGSLMSDDGRLDVEVSAFIAIPPEGDRGIGPHTSVTNPAQGTYPTEDVPPGWSPAGLRFDDAEGGLLELHLVIEEEGCAGQSDCESESVLLGTLERTGFSLVSPVYR